MTRIVANAVVMLFIGTGTVHAATSRGLTYTVAGSSSVPPETIAFGLLIGAGLGVAVPLAIYLKRKKETDRSQEQVTEYESQLKELAPYVEKRINTATDIGKAKNDISACQIYRDIAEKQTLEASTRLRSSTDKYSAIVAASKAAQAVGQGGKPSKPATGESAQPEVRSDSDFSLEQASVRLLLAEASKLLTRSQKLKASLLQPQGQHRISQKKKGTIRKLLDEAEKLLMRLGQTYPLYMRGQYDEACKLIEEAEAKAAPKSLPDEVDEGRRNRGMDEEHEEKSEGRENGKNSKGKLQKPDSKTGNNGDQEKEPMFMFGNSKDSSEPFRGFNMRSSRGNPFLRDDGSGHHESPFNAPPGNYGSLNDSREPVPKPANADGTALRPDLASFD